MAEKYPAWQSKARAAQKDEVERNARIQFNQDHVEGLRLNRVIDKTREALGWIGIEESFTRKLFWLYNGDPAIQLDEYVLYLSDHKPRPGGITKFTVGVSLVEIQEMLDGDEEVALEMPYEKYRPNRVDITHYAENCEVDFNGLADFADALDDILSRPVYMETWLGLRADDS